MYIYFVTCSLSKDTCRVIKSLSLLFHNTPECADEKYIGRNDKNLLILLILPMFFPNMCV